MKSSPKVSVIIPNYNHAPYLEQRIESVLNQTYKDFEVILLDDCSTDNSIKVLRRYEKHPKVQDVYINKENSGSTFRQWEKGIGMAKGEYIWIAESDDWAHPEFLREMIQGVSGNEDTFIASSQIISVNSKDETIRKGHPWTADIDQIIWDFQDSKTFPVGSLSELFAYKNILPNASSCVFKKNAVDPQIFTLISKFSLVGDLLFWFHLSLKGNIFLSKQTVSYCRFHENNVGRKPLLSTGNLMEILFSRKYVMNKTHVSFQVVLKSRKLYSQLFLSQLRIELNSNRERLAVIIQAIKIGLTYPKFFFYSLYLGTKKKIMRILSRRNL